MISEAAPRLLGASCTITHRPVLRTDATMVSKSMGEMVRRSISSIDAPRSSPMPSAAARAVRIMAPQAITVTSLPSRTTSALPMGICSGSSGTSSRKAR